MQKLSAIVVSLVFVGACTSAEGVTPTTTIPTTTTSSTSTTTADKHEAHEANKKVVEARIAETNKLIQERIWYSELQKQMLEAAWYRQAAEEDETESISHIELVPPTEAYVDGTFVYDGVSFSSAMESALLPFFACVAKHESGGNYGAVNPSGKYRGRYQMDQTFWRTHARAEDKHYAESYNWETAPPEAQDATAVNGYHNQGPGAWSGPNGPICTSLIP